MSNFKTDKSEKLMQKEAVLGKKVEIWNRFFKIGQGKEESGPSVKNGPLTKEKWMGTSAEAETKPNVKKEAETIRKGKQTGKARFCTVRGQERG